MTVAVPCFSWSGFFIAEIEGGVTPVAEVAVGVECRFPVFSAVTVTEVVRGVDVVEGLPLLAEFGLVPVSLAASASGVDLL